MLPVRHPDRPEPGQPVRCLPPHTGRHHGGNPQAGDRLAQSTLALPHYCLLLVQVTIQFCRFCERYLQPPQQWVQAALESRELMALCLKKLKGLARVKLIGTVAIFLQCTYVLVYHSLLMPLRPQ